MNTTTDLLEPFFSLALDLSRGLSTRARYERLVEVVQRVVPGDAVALLRLEGSVLVPVAVSGLDPKLLGVALDPKEHPRLRAIVEAREIVHFDGDDPRPDPYDGLVLAAPGERLGGRVHSCLGVPLRVEGELVGCLTADALEPGRFDRIHERLVSMFAALAAASMRTASLIERLDQLAQTQERVAQELVFEALARQGSGLVGRSPVMQALQAEMDLAARSGLPVLVSGETGVGKELVARIIHARSGRARKPIVAVNCAALPESLAESELFGHVKGAFTGAVAERAGRFEVAHGGALFLDEIGELPLSLQPLLLRAVQFGEVQPVGASRAHRVDVWIIAATNRDLPKEIAEGRFREDLYHRVSAFPVHVPPLRERQGDIPLLVQHFLDESALKLGLRSARVAPEVSGALERYPWPGNVRELSHVIFRAAVRASGGGRQPEITIGPEHLDLREATLAPPPPPARPDLDPAEVEPMAEATDRFQRGLIERAVQACDGNWAEAARRLHVDKSNLHRTAVRLGLKG